MTRIAICALLAALALANCREPDPVAELDGVEPWKAAMFCSAALERSGKIFSRLARSSEDAVDRRELTEEAQERREAALDFGRRGIKLAESAGIERAEIRRALAESDALFEDNMQTAPTIEDYAAHLADRVDFCVAKVDPALD